MIDRHTEKLFLFYDMDGDDDGETVMISFKDVGSDKNNPNIDVYEVKNEPSVFMWLNYNSSTYLRESVIKDFVSSHRKQVSIDEMVDKMMLEVRKKIYGRLDKLTDQLIRHIRVHKNYICAVVRNDEGVFYKTIDRSFTRYLFAPHNMEILRYQNDFHTFRPILFS